MPPRMDPLEVVVVDPRNDKYFATWGKQANAAPSAAVKPDGTAAKGETAEILNTIFERGGNKADPALVDLWKEASRQRD